MGRKIKPRLSFSGRQERLESNDWEVQDLGEPKGKGLIEVTPSTESTIH